MRALYQTVPSSRGHASRGRASRLRAPRIQTGTTSREYASQSQEDLASRSLPPSLIPKAVSPKRSPTAGPQKVHDRGLSPQSPSTWTAPDFPLAPSRESDSATEVLSPTDSQEEAAELVTAPESPSEPSDLNSDTSVGEFPPLPDLVPHLDAYEQCRIVSCTSTVFFDAPGSLTSQLGSVMSDIEEQPAIAHAPDLDGQDSITPQQSLFQQVNSGLGRVVSSNYSPTRTASTPTPPASPTSHLSPVLAPETLCEELPSEVETIRRRLCGYSSKMFKSSTWSQNSDLGIASLGRLSFESGIEDRLCVDSEESTIIEASKGARLLSRAASVGGFRLGQSSQSNTLGSSRKGLTGPWHDGTADASRAASAEPPIDGDQPSIAETCTITSTQAIKSRTFSSANVSSDTSTPRVSGDGSSRAEEEPGSRELLSSEAHDLKQGLSVSHTSDGSVVEPTNEDMGDMGLLVTRTETTGDAPTGGVTSWVRKTWEKYSPAAVTKSLVRLFGYGDAKGADGSEGGNDWKMVRFKSGGSWRSWRSRKSSRGVRRKKLWRVRMPWVSRRAQEAPLLTGGSR